MTMLARWFRGGRWLSPGAGALLLLPFALVMALAFVYPLFDLLSQGLFAPNFTTAHYQRVFDQPVYLRILWRTLLTAFSVTVLCLVLGFPVAYLLARLQGFKAAVVAACILLPLWSSVLVRTYAWVVMLRREGLVNSGLQSLGLIDAPLKLLYTEGAVLVAMAHVLLPFVVLPIYGTLKNIPPDYERAALVMGAKRFQVFREVILPLSMPGVASGSLMVFLTAIGFYVTPALIGGPQQMMISTLISQQVRELLNWPFASALVGVLLVVVLGIAAVFNRAIGIDRLTGGKA